MTLFYVCSIAAFIAICAVRYARGHDLVYSLLYFFATFGTTVFLFMVYIKGCEITTDWMYTYIKYAVIPAYVIAYIGTKVLIDSATPPDPVTPNNERLSENCVFKI